MSTAAAPVGRPALRVTRSTVTLLALAALAWAGSVPYARRMGNSLGSMGMAFGPFVAMWASMMTAMMLPAVAPVASVYTRTITTNRVVRVSLFVGGYLLVWASVGIPVYGVLRVVDHVVGDSDTIMRNIAVGLLVATGLYQLSPLKSRFVSRCRSPLAQLSSYDNLKGGPLCDLKIGLQHGVSCLACSWALMALFIAFGVMNLWAMVALAGVVAGERLLPRGGLVARWAGATCLLLAALVLASPRATDALVPSASSTSNMNMTGTVTRAHSLARAASWSNAAKVSEKRN